MVACAAGRQLAGTTGGEALLCGGQLISELQFRLTMQCHARRMSSRQDRDNEYIPVTWGIA